MSQMHSSAITVLVVWLMVVNLCHPCRASLYSGESYPPQLLRPFPQHMEEVDHLAVQALMVSTTPGRLLKNTAPAPANGSR